MNEIIAQSADGKQHVFPAGTPDDVIDRAMMDYAAQQQANAPRDFGNPTLNKIAGAMDTVVKPIETFGQKATDMMALGGLDEITALPGAAYDALTTGQGFGDAYKGRLTEQEARARALSERDPVASVAGSVTGAIAGPAAKAGAQFVNQGANMLTRAARATIPGAATGTVAGFLGTEGGLGERAEGAAWGTATGALLAPVAQVGGELLGKFIGMFSRGKQALPAVPQGQIDDPLQAAVQAQQGPTKVSQGDLDAGIRRLFRALEADGVDVQKVMQMAQAGQLDDRTLAGLAGPNTRQMIDTFASMNGPAKTIVAGAQRAAEQGQSQNIMKAAGQSLGVKQGFTDLGDMLEAQKADAGPLYDAFYAVSPDKLNTPFMQNLLKNPLAKELLGTARLINQVDQAAGKTPDDVLQYLLDAEGNVSTGQSLSPRAADYVKRALDQKVREHMDDFGNVKGAVGQAWDGLRRAFLKDIDAAVPEFSAARQAYAGPASMEDAMNIGRKILKDDWIANRKIIEEMTKSEKEALKVGAFQAVDDMLSGISSKADKAARLANVDKYLERLWPAFDTRKAFDAFKKSIMSQTAEFGAIQMAGKGSQTAPRAFDAMDQGIETAATAAQAAGGNKGSLLSLGKDAIRWLSAPNTAARAAAVSGALGKVQDVLPYMGAINRPPSALGSVLSGSVAYPASGAKARADALLGRAQ